MDVQAAELSETEVEQGAALANELLQFLSTVVVGQQVLLQRIMIGLLAQGHILLEGPPGLAKTLAVKSFAQSVDAKFSRVQFTPDILPADILGTMIYNMGTNEFNIKHGPIFANFVLADEINRAPEKVQSALLEVMQEHQVTIGNTTFPLAPPFMVLATQNPIDQNGTYELPEAQMDRFMMKVVITYPSLENERLIIRKNIKEEAPRYNVLSLESLRLLQKLVGSVFIDSKIENYILNIVFCTRFPADYGLPQLKDAIRYGASPRGSINLARAAQAYAFLQKRNYVMPTDIKAIVHDVLRHRIGLTYTAIAANTTADDVLKQIIDTIPMP